MATSAGPLSTSSITTTTTGMGVATTGSVTTIGGGGTGAEASATDGTGEPVDLGSVTFAMVTEYIRGYCATSNGCHGSGAREVVLLGDSLYDTLMTYTVAECEHRYLIVPYDPSASALYGVISGGCGAFRMPPMCRSDTCTGADNLRLVETWILDGAPSD